MDARTDVEIAIRGPQGYDLAKRALEAMEREKVWPTALNYELWMHVVGDPNGDLAEELQRLIDAGQPITEDVSEELAARYLPKQRLNEQIRDAGDQLSKELAAVSAAISKAKEGQAAYGETLSKASSALFEADVVDAQRVITSLTTATRKIQKDNMSLERRLAESVEEVNRLKEHLEQVRRDATTDALTNLANRKAFDEEGERALSDADQSGESVILALLDIDHFKSFNDTWGHQTGDQVIRFVASVIGRMAAPPRFAARYGGEEFAMLFPGESQADVFDCLEEIRQEISSRMLKRRSTNEDLGTITISAGMAERAPGESLDAALDRADSALYASKHAGRNTTSRAKDMARAA
jgi:diguanylate cyclase